MCNHPGADRCPDTGQVGSAGTITDSSRQGEQALSSSEVRLREFITIRVSEKGVTAPEDTPLPTIPARSPPPRDVIPGQPPLFDADWLPETVLSGSITDVESVFCRNARPR
jgi:hypothetical protein